MGDDEESKRSLEAVVRLPFDESLTSSHLLERGHGERFARLMDKRMSDWMVRRDQLNQAPLASEKWVSP